MSNALAIAGVTAVLKDLLDTGLIENQVTDAMGQGVTVSAVAPDSIELTGDNLPRLNIFLHQVTPNAALRNMALPARGQRGDRLRNPLLAVDLHYLVTAYAMEDLQAEVLLGYAMQLLEEAAVISREAIRVALNPSPVNGSVLPTIYQALRAADLAEQLELIKVTPCPMDTEEMSRLWSAIQAHYRPTAAYHVSVVLIESARPTRSTLPVLTRGPVDPATLRERGVVVQPGLLPAVPTIESVVPPGGQPAARLGETIDVTGHHLDGTGREVVLAHLRQEVERVVPALAAGGYALVRFTLPVAPADLPAGVYRLAVRLVRPGEAEPRTSNDLALVVAPEITTALPINVARDAEGNAEVTLSFRPEVRPGQRTSLLLGQREVSAPPITAATGTLTFTFDDIPPGTYLVRLRVDGVESPVLDRTAEPPVFLDRRITVT